MADSTQPRALTQAPAPELHRELTMLQESQLITAEQQRALVAASGGLQRMQATSTPVGKRHFNRIDTLLAVRAPTPVSQAREALATLGEVWEGLSGDFHRYREMYFEVKLRKAKLAKRRKEMVGQDDDDATIAEAEMQLEQARIDAMEATMAKGHATLQAAMTTATAASQKYALICKAAGKEEFTDDDFLAEEVEHLLKSAFWHVSTNYRRVELGSEPRNKRPHTVARTTQEIRLYLEGLGISWDVVAKELGILDANMGGIDAIHAGRDNAAEKQARFYQWLDRMAATYKPQALASVREHGRARLERISALLNPKDEGPFTAHGKQLERMSLEE